MVRLRIQEMATARGFNQKKLRDATNITTTQLSKLWHNHLQRVDLESLGKIARTLGVQPGDLIVFSYDEVS